MRWATRAGVHVDRAACAWLLRRFVDPEAEFVFVDDPDDVPADATAFDMRGAELSHHEGDCRSTAMKWVTRARPKTDRIACPWLIRRYIDPEAEILYVPKDDVLAVAEAQGAHSFDAPGARYDHRADKCTFEVLIEDYSLADVPALARLDSRCRHHRPTPAGRLSRPASTTSPWHQPTRPSRHPGGEPPISLAPRGLAAPRLP